MAGKDEIANAVLGGASDYMSDIYAKLIQWYYTKDDQKVCCKLFCTSIAYNSHLKGYLEYCNMV